MSYFNSLLTVVNVPKRTVYYKLGETNNCLSFINTGLLKCYVLDKENREVVIHFPKEDWWVSDVNSFYFKEPSRFQYETIENSQLVQITHDKLEVLFLKYPKFENAFHNLLKRYIISFHERYINLLTKSAKERYELFALKYPDLVQRVPQKSIASYLGVTPEFLSKMRGMR